MTIQGAPVITDSQKRRNKLRRLIAVAALAATVVGCGGGGSGDGDPNINYIEPGPALPVPGGTLPNIATSKKDFNDVHFAGSAVCADCHNNDQSLAIEDRPMVVNTDSGVKKDVSIGIAWETSTMANSARDPYWHAVVASEIALYPNLEDTINDKCTVCHAPMANTLAKKESGGVNYKLFGTGSVAEGNFQPGLLDLDDTSEMFNHAMDGVSCSLCHQIEDVGLGTAASMTGGYTIPTIPEANKDQRPAYGQYANPDVVYMQTVAEFKPVYSAHISTSETCATCHNLNIEPVDKNGELSDDFTHFAEQAMYTEWLESDYAVGKPLEASCQDCHMPKLDRDVFLATSNASNKRPNFAEHTFLAANTVMQQIMHDNKGPLGIDADLDFLPSIARNREFLKTSATVDVQANTLNNGILDFDVTVTNLTGHKLPSGYHSRRAYLHVVITDSNGTLVYENGRMAPDGSIAGVDEDVNPTVWEPHHEVITSATQVQVYQAITGNDDNERTHSLLNSAYFLKDNRLTPAGFDKNNVSADVAVMGLAVNDANFNLGTDTTKYLASLNGGVAPYDITVYFRYQPISKGHLDDLFSQSDTIPSVDHFRTMYEQVPFKDEVMAFGSATIQ